jgi:hypothetical protein
MRNQLYSLSNNGFQPIPQAPELAIGTKVRLNLTGCDCFGAIISADKHNYNIVKLDEYHAGFSQTDKHHIQPLSKKFGIGIYYVDCLEIVFPEIISEFIAKAHAADARKLEEKRIKKEADEKEILELPALYPHLKPIKEDYKAAKKNLIAELKANFKGEKFSVRVDRYAVQISTALSKEEVKKVTDKFKGSVSSYCGDFRDSNESNFNKVFGGFNYIFIN